MSLYNWYFLSEAFARLETYILYPVIRYVLPWTGIGNEFIDWNNLGIVVLLISFVSMDQN